MSLPFERINKLDIFRHGFSCTIPVQPPKGAR
jgi:hypothetical protein